MKMRPALRGRSRAVNNVIRTLLPRLTAALRAIAGLSAEIHYAGVKERETGGCVIVRRITASPYLFRPHGMHQVPGGRAMHRAAMLL